MTNKELLDLGVALGELKGTMARLREELDEARAVIRTAERMVNGHADNDHRIAVEVLRPYLARFPEVAA